MFAIRAGAISSSIPKTNANCPGITDLILFQKEITQLLVHHNYQFMEHEEQYRLHLHQFPEKLLMEGSQ